MEAPMVYNNLMVCLSSITSNHLALYVLADVRIWVFCFKIPNPELQVREIPHPGKSISDTVWYNFILHVLKHGKTIILNSNFSDVPFTLI